jgi:hypothetical protein
MAKVVIECENTGSISDGYHTFDELYAHRIMLFLCLMKFNRDISWRSRIHYDGTSFDGWFIAGMNLSSGNITYHIPDKFWNMINDIQTLEKAPEWDGHTSEDVIRRLNNWGMSI